MFSRFLMISFMFTISLVRYVIVDLNVHLSTFRISTGTTVNSDAAIVACRLRFTRNISRGITMTLLFMLNTLVNSLLRILIVMIPLTDVGGYFTVLVSTLRVGVVFDLG